MKIFDCFPFFNELELAHLRFMEYYDFVDYFVVVEATKSHTGKDKPLFFNNNKYLFEKYSDKIIHIIIDDLPGYSVDDIWTAENFQRIAIQRGLNSASIGDKIFISDCDEFWDINKAKECINEQNIIFEQNLYYYYVNCVQNCKWLGSIMETYSGSINCQELRNNARNGFGKIIRPGGWHYSFMGGAKRIRQKVENIAESHLIIKNVGDENQIYIKMDLAIDLWNRSDDYAQKKFVDISDYQPKALNEFLKLYPDFKK